MLRPALVCIAALMTASCGMVEGDAHRFEGIARQVADIHLEGATDAPAGSDTAQAQGLRPAIAPGSKATRQSRLQVQVMDPHDLWDARDAAVSGVIERVGARAVEAAAPVMTEAVVQRASDRIVERAAMRPAIARPAPAAVPSVASAGPKTTIQLGAYSSPEAARAAWAVVSGGAARNALKGLSPVFEAVQVNGRPFTRLRVAAPTATAAAICRAAEVSDPWCARRV